MKNTPKWGENECAIWAPSKMRHHPNTAMSSPSQRPPLPSMLAKITAPTLILKADAQGQQRQENEDAVKGMAHVKLVHIDGAGHNVRRENKPMMLRVTKEFLAAIK
jgi:pimeloyl-ACP methyl ester carboxylesterase